LRGNDGLIRCILAVVAGLLAAVLVAGPGRAQTDAGKAVADRIEAAYGVKVLRSRVVHIDGRAAYELTVMNPAGNYNEAFQVNRLLVDAATGKLISAFEHEPAGYRLSDPPPGAEGLTGEDVGRAARRSSLAH